MEELTPITRIEQFLDGIVNSGEVPDSAVTRVETFLDCIVNNQTCALPPVTRIETYLAKISGASVTVPEPVTRIELYLAAIAGEDVELPEQPITRVEYWLNEWANGGVVPEWATASGAIASFTTVRSAPLKELVANIEPVQSGSGDPSPSNVRPITGHTRLNVWVKSAYDPTADPTTSVDFSTVGTIYGGTLDVITGELLRTQVLSSQMTGSGWSTVTVGGANYFCKSHNGFNNNNNIVACSHFKPMPTASTLGNNPDCSIQIATDRYYQLNVRYDAISTVEEFSSFITNNAVQMAITSADPVTFNLPPQQISTLQGQNNVWTGIGNVTATYAYPDHSYSNKAGTGKVGYMKI